MRNHPECPTSQHELETPPVGRLAPSPTGLLHIGHARSFALAWASIRSRGGRLVLRVEDLDAERSRPEFVEAALADLEWLGLDWDGAWSLQSANRERIAAAGEQLERRAAAYACSCSRADIRRALSAPHEPWQPPGTPPAALGAADEPRYPLTCRGRFGSRREAREQTGTPSALRFETPDERVSFEDLVRGPIELAGRAELGDFVVVRRDGCPAYQLAVTVDDAADGITEVVRGDDLLTSTGRQLLLQRALGLPHPRWGHLPLVVDDDGRRLAKRTAGLALAEIREAGADPRALLGWVAASAGLELPRRLSPAEFVAGFQGLERQPFAPVRFGERERREWLEP